MEQGNGTITPPQQDPTPDRSGRGRRLAELGTVAVLSAALAAGGTWGIASATDDGTGGGATTTATASPSSSGSTQTVPVKNGSDSPDWNAVTDAVAPSVVSLTVRTGSSGAQGSGVVIDDKGHVLTNHHVVAGAAEGGRITVSLADGSTYRATIAGTDESTDLAVVTIKDPPKDLKPVTLGSSKDLQVGDPVMAVGNPLGLAGTVTTGVVSALNRPVSTSSADEGGGQGLFSPQQSEPVVTSAIQTSAAINPGNSGGALVDASGRLIGINSSIASVGQSSGSSGNIGIGFAIPVDEASWIADQLIENGHAEHAFLGVRPTDGTAQLGSASRTGAKLVDVIDGTPAQEAGLQRGDLIVSLDGTPVKSAESLVGLVHARKIGSTVPVTYIRDGSEKTVQLTLATAPEGQAG
ncbi:S1C family serine protease [Janibacter corallicola]|uniref:S1C family serine protease n=1 Tax=Janibacter corallicola TaxID=415212 RepID=UPI000A003385|nr:trypsin-like peptidase domain-containing protein [Janibacter corallicola]